MATLLHLRLTPRSASPAPLPQVVRELALALVDVLLFHAADPAEHLLIERIEPELRTTDDTPAQASLLLSGQGLALTTFMAHLLTLATGMERDALAEMARVLGWGIDLPSLARALEQACTLGAFTLSDELRRTPAPCRCSLCTLITGDSARLAPLWALLEADDSTAQAAEQLVQLLHPDTAQLARLLDRADTAPPPSWYALSRCVEAWFPRLAPDSFVLLEQSWRAAPGRQATVLPVLAQQQRHRSRALAFVVEHLEETGPRARVAVDIAPALGEQTQRSLLPTMTALLDDPAQLALHEPIILSWRRTWATDERPPDEVQAALTRRGEQTDAAGKLAAWAATSWDP